MKKVPERVHRRRARLNPALIGADRLERSAAACSADPETTADFRREFVEKTSARPPSRALEASDLGSPGQISGILEPGVQERGRRVSNRQGNGGGDSAISQGKGYWVTQAMFEPADPSRGVRALAELSRVSRHGGGSHPRALDAAAPVATGDSSADDAAACLHSHVRSSGGRTRSDSGLGEPAGAGDRASSPPHKIRLGPDEVDALHRDRPGRRGCGLFPLSPLNQLASHQGFFVFSGFVVFASGLGGTGSVPSGMRRFRASLAAAIDHFGVAHGIILCFYPRAPGERGASEPGRG